MAFLATMEQDPIDKTQTIISVYVDEEVKRKLVAEAEADGRSLSNLATRILEAWLREKGEAQ